MNFTLIIRAPISIRCIIAALIHFALATIAHAATVNLSVGCSWFSTPVSYETGNTGYPDVNASYYIAALPTAPSSDTEIIAEGSYAHVRYFSFETLSSYSFADFVDELADFKIAPLENNQPASTLPLNPAALPFSNNYQDHYKVIIKFANPPANPNAREPNTIYAGVVIPRLTVPQIVFRRYLANPGYSVLDTSELPTLTYVGPQGSIPLTQTPDTSGCAQLESSLSGGESTTLFVNPLVGMPNPRFGPVWFERLVPYPNMDSAYLEAFTSMYYAPLVVVRVKVPLTPATANNSVPQARYWSICQDSLHSTATVACLADNQIVTQADGYSTFVISTASQRPALADSSAGYNWLPWADSSTQTPGGYIPLREILPNPAFEGSYYKWVHQWGLPGSKVIGDYAPQSTYCDLATFNANAGSGGLTLFQACQAAYPFHPPTLSKSAH